MSERMSIEDYMQRDLAGRTVPKLVPHVKSQWLSDLRINPKYSEQGKGRLKSRKPHCKTEYCCLGVLSDRIFEQTGKKPERIGYPKGLTVFKFENDSILLNQFILNRSGLNYYVARALAAANDCGFTFAEIADWIEEYL